MKNSALNDVIVDDVFSDVYSVMKNMFNYIVGTSVLYIIFHKLFNERILLF